VWEWTRTLWGKEEDKSEFQYPYSSEDGREDISSATSHKARILRGGAYFNDLTQVATYKVGKQLIVVAKTNKTTLSSKPTCEVA
jgi:hypothetical protein